MTMQFRLVDSEWEREFCDAMSTDHSEIRIICPFIKEQTVKRILAVGTPRVIEVLTRFCLADFYNGVSDTAALRLLIDKGAKIRGIQNLHAKVYLFGQRRVISTSANLTDAALKRNHEFGFIADGGEIIGQCRKYFDQLWRRGGDNLSISKIADWDKLVEGELTRGSCPSDRAKLPDFGIDLGLITPSQSLQPWIADAPQSFVKFFGEGHRRELRNKTISMEVEGAGCHWSCTYPKGKRPRQVKNGAVIFMGRLVREPNDIIVYGRAIALEHQPGRDDASQAEIEKRHWRERYSHYIRVHHAEFIAGNLSNGISLNQLMEELGENSFKSTQKHAALKDGKNINPRRAFQQQPAVKLSNEGYEWLTKKLEVAIQTYGKIPKTELDQLDWPASGG